MKFTISVFACLGIFFSTYLPLKAQEICGTEAAMAKLSAAQREEMLKGSLTSVVPAKEILLYLHFDAATIMPGSPQPTGFRSPLITATRNVPSPNMTPEQILQTIELVNDDFAPFNIRITTNYNEFLNYPTGNKHLNIITTLPGVLGLPSNVGGVAPFVGIGTRLFSNPSFTFAQKHDNNPIAVADMISHEVAHTLGLAHQPIFTNKCGFVFEYHAAFGSGALAFGPIMGGALEGSSNFGISNWWSQECQHPQYGGPLHDFELINNQVVLKTDDFPNSVPGTSASFPINGNLEQAGDVDLIRITSATGNILSAESGNVDLVASVFNASGTLLGRFNDPDRPGVSFPVSGGIKDIRIRAARNPNMDSLFMTGKYTLKRLPDNGPINYTAIGDSLAFGTGANVPSVGGYVARFREKLELLTDQVVALDNRGVFGTFSAQLLTAVQTDAAMRTSLQNANIITFNIGGNDLGLARLQYRNNTCGGSDGQDCLRSAVTALKTNWIAIIAELRALNPTADIRTIDIYYPAVNFDSSQDSFPGDGGSNDFQVLNSYLTNVNAYIASTAGTNHMNRGHAHVGFNGLNGTSDPSVGGLLASDLTHPNDTGHELIATSLIASESVTFGIDPEAITVLMAGTQQFSAAGGAGPYVFSLVQNQSGGSVNANSGLYAAGSNIGTDIIRVTDNIGATADATVTVNSVSAASISGRVVDLSGRGIARATIVVMMPNGDRKLVQTSTFGYYRSDDLPVGNAYTVSVRAKRYTFDVPTRMISLFTSVGDVDFVGSLP